MIRNLGQRAGYNDKLTSYCFPPGYGNAIDSTYLDTLRSRRTLIVVEIVTAAQRRQLIGHLNDGVSKSYVIDDWDQYTKSYLAERTTR